MSEEGYYNMKKIMYGLEGTADAVFISCYVKHLLKANGMLFQEKKDKEKLTISSADFRILIDNIGGINRLGTNKDQLKEYETEGYSIFLIVDTDTKDSHANHYGGRTQRLKYLNEQKKEFNLNFNSFLLPFDDESDGDLETLLMAISNKENFSLFNSCYEVYCNCISRISNTDLSMSELTKSKHVVFNFIQVFSGMQKAKEGSRDYSDKSLWNLDSEYLDPLKNFISNHLGIEPVAGF